jgi:hypothetical protein
MTIDGVNIEPNTAAFINFMKGLESDDEPASLVVHAVPLTPPCHQQKAQPCVDEADAEMDDCEECAPFGLYRRAARLRSEHIDQPAAVALTNFRVRQAF